METRKPLAPRQKDMLEFIKVFMAIHGWPPSITQLCERSGLARSTVHSHIQALHRKGYIKLGPTDAKQMRVVR